MTTAVYHRSQSVEWSTPQDLFDEYDREFAFTLDAAATHINAKCSRFFTEREDGLAQLWSGSVWCNPPYGGRETGKWVRKGYEAAQQGATVVLLVPSRTDTRWWHDYAMKGEVRFLRGRLRFGGSKNSAPFPSAVVVFRP
jgi:phage N-6-adenine-methyltransferase